MLMLLASTVITCSFSLWAQLDDSRPWKYFSKVQTCQEGFARIAGVLRLPG